MAKLIVKLGDKVIREISLVKPETTIGRNIENDIQIDNLAVSNFHARIVKEGEQFFVQDLGSLNGTYLSGKKIELSELNFGDEVSIAKHTLIFEQDDIPFPASGSRQAASSLNLDQTMVLDTRQHRQMEGRTTRPMTSSGQVGVLIVDKGNAEAAEFELLDEYVTIGKNAEADFHIKGFFAPGVAAHISRTDKGYFVVPPESGKKPLLNGEKVAARAPLSDGDTLEAGGVRMRFILRDTDKTG